MRSILLAAAVLGAASVVGCHADQSKSATVAKHAQQCSADCAAAEKEVAAIEAAPSAMATAEAAPEPVWTYGGEPKLSDAVAIPAARVVADPAAYADQRVRVTGTVTDVCAKKGCWLRVAPAGAPKGSPDLFIKFTDPPTGRLVPMEAVGHDVTVEGTLKQGVLSERAARHFKEDAGVSREEVEKIVGPQKQLVVAGAIVAIDGIAPRAGE